MRAEQGAQWAIDELAGPPFPYRLAYLLKWLYRLHGRSGAGMSGILPLSDMEIAAWSWLSGIRPEPWEVELLIECDGILCHPPAKESKEAVR